MTPIYNTTEYQFSHGKKPRGIATWAFIPNDYCWPGDDMPADAIAWEWGSYSDAKRKVAAKWPAVTVWRVLP